MINLPHKKINAAANITTAYAYTYANLIVMCNYTAVGHEGLGRLMGAYACKCWIAAG